MKKKVINSIVLTLFFVVILNSCKKSEFNDVAPKENIYVPFQSKARGIDINSRIAADENF